MNKLDFYIIRKFLMTFFFVLVIFVLIAMVIDITEKLGDFISKKVPLEEIILVYYLSFIPYIAALLTPVFVCIAVVYFTSRMASNTEVIAIFSSGISFTRFIRPYVISACIITGFMLYANHWLVPQANKNRVEFEDKYIRHISQHFLSIHLTADRNDKEEINVSMSRFSFAANEGFHFSMETIRDNQLVRQVRAPRVVWLEESSKWQLHGYEDWQINGKNETYTEGAIKEVDINFSPADFILRTEIKDRMDYNELNDFIARERLRGSEKVPFWEVEKHMRTANAFAIIVLTLIGISFSVQKKRGGMGFNLVMAIFICLMFIIFLRFSTTFATNANLHPVIATWIPNVTFGIFSLLLLYKARR